MATEFLQSYLDGALYVLTSSVSSIKASTEKPCIDVSLICENGPDGEMETFYSTSLYAFDNVVEMSDVGLLIEEYFRMRNKVSDTITFVFDDVTMDVHFLYCEYSMPPDFNPEKSFFIASSVQRVHQDSTVAIAAVYRGTTTPFLIRAVGHNSSGALAVVEKSVMQDFNREGTAYFLVSDIVRWALDKTEDGPGADLCDVLYFSIEYAGIQKMCYIVPASAYLTFSFRNVFNVEEFVDVVGVMTAKTDVSRDVAVCNGTSKQYDRTIERSFQVQSEPLASVDFHVFEQLIASHRVILWIDDMDWDVIITDHTYEPSSSDDSLTVVKFTWRFADQRPRIFDSLVDGIIPERRKIFDKTFSNEYE